MTNSMMLAFKLMLIFQSLILILLLLPHSNMIVSNKYFTYSYSKKRFINRHKKLFKKIFKI